MNLFELLHNNAYPGRGIVLGVTPDGRSAVAAYFIMGRSVNSRNRVFVPTSDGIRTQAHDPSLMTDPSLIIYHPVRETPNGLIVTNGDQTDTIRDFFSSGSTFETALHTRTFEPDAPNFTPRISGLQHADGSYTLAILKAADSEGAACARYFFEYPPLPGTGHFLHTYAGDSAAALPAFAGEPERVTIAGNIDTFTAGLWESLNQDNKISLYVRYTDIATGTYEQRIINKHNLPEASA